MQSQPKFPAGSFFNLEEDNHQVRNYILHGFCRVFSESDGY